ncbi:MAG: lamin tail domain-containing protein [Planctomycetota bacterium]|nr:lamin tail domain-containing protein [Planctomycetota bacterium]
MNKFALLALLGVSATASADLVITETFIGLDGEDGTSDWIEVTNTGPGMIDTADFWYDDVNPSLADGGQLDSFLLNPGESAVFLIAGNPAAITEFTAVWGSVPRVGLTNGGGGLSQDGDEVNLLNSGGAVLDTLAYDASFSIGLQTIERLPGGTARLSILGENGAYESNEFFNDNIGPSPDFMVSIVGSPGAIPAPGAVALMGVAGLVGLRRRR